MSDVLKKLALLQLPLLGYLVLWWWQGKERPVYGVVIAASYQVFLVIVAAAIAFVKKVWSKLEDRAVQSTADYIWSAVSDFAPGFPRRYRKHVVNEFGKFNVRGLGLINTYTLPLEQVFVDLRVNPNNQSRFNLDPLTKKELEGNKPIWDCLRLLKSPTAEAIGLAVYGPPGCGKTTLLQHVAITFAANRQRRYRFRAYTPLLLYLRDHIPTITQEKPPALGKLAEDYFGDASLFPTLKPPPKWFQKQLERGECIVLLDGLDEVAELSKRKLVSAWVDKQIKSYSRCLFVLTSRPKGYTDAPLQNAYVLEVQPFNAEQVRRFVENWYLANEIISSGGKDDAAVRQRAYKSARDLLLRLSSSPSLSALTVNPLLLTMIAMIHCYHGALPGTRVELYAEICEVLLGRWRQARGVQEPMSAAQKLAVLQPLAAHMMERKLNYIPTEEAMKVIAEPLEEVGVTGEAAARFLGDLQTDSGLLLERESGVWSFAHLSFQEYLTARFWLENREAGRDWAALVGDSWWQEMLRLYAAQGDATPLIQACMSVDSVTALTLAAECLAEVLRIAPEVRRAAEERLFAGLEADEPTRQRLAAEVQLARRLKSLQPIDEQREIDLGYLTCAEYQLFLDDMQARGEYRQPDHWLGLRFESGAARQPLGGVRADDALAFCEWLTARHGGNVAYRLPRLEEARKYPAALGILSAWCTDGSDYVLYGLADSDAAEIERKLSATRGSDAVPQPPIGRDLARSFARALSYELPLNVARVLGFDPATQTALHFGATSSRAFNVELDIARTLALDIARKRGQVRDIHRDRDIALALAHAFDGDPVVKQIVEVLDRNDLAHAQRLTQSLKAEKKNAVPIRLVTLLDEIIASANAQSSEEARRTRRRYISRVLEYSYATNLRSESGSARSEKRDTNGQGSTEELADIYWWLQIAMGREEGRLPAWEGIRIVREQMLVNM